VTHALEGFTKTQRILAQPVLDPTAWSAMTELIVMTVVIQPDGTPILVPAKIAQVPTVSTVASVQTTTGNAKLALATLSTQRLLTHKNSAILA